MKLTLIGAALVLAAGGISCSSNAPAGRPADAAAGSAMRQAGAGAQAARAPQINIPKDANWTIYCAAISGPNHAARAGALKDQLARSTRLPEWYVVQSDEGSTLYYGFYSDEKDSRAKHDRQIIGDIVAANGERLFSQACLMPLDLADPTAPPEWNLANLKGKEYTLEIGAYRDDPRRKEYAVQAVREARAEGVEAYYYHGPTSSIVCVGAWPPEAVQEPTEVRADNPNEVVVVAPANVKLPDIDPGGRVVHIVHPQIKLNDPSIEAMMRKYPLHLTNGSEIKRKITDVNTRQVVVTTDRSVLVHIPQRDVAQRSAVPGWSAGPDLPSPGPAAGIAAEGTKASKPAPRPQPQGGRLRSLED